MATMKPRILCKHGRKRPFVLILPGKRNRSFSKFDAAVGAAVQFVQATLPGPAPTAAASLLDDNASLPALRRFRVRGVASDMLQSRTVDYTVSARGRGPAVTIVADLLSARGLTLDRATTRMLPIAKIEGSAARMKRGKAMLSSKRRTQRGAAETRVLRNVGLSQEMAEIALAAAAGPVRIARK